MLCYVLTTGQCNLRCGYCGGSFPQKSVPYKVTYAVDQLASFLDGAKDLTIAFYGGEPLLNPSWIEAVMDNVDADHYVIQTNGLLLDRLEDDYWLHMDTVLLSIDGDRDVTDYYRGAGVYDAVLRSASKLRSLNHKGELVARMTASRISDIHRDVNHLLSTRLFDTIHWQIDAIWSPEWNGFDQWLRRSYETGVATLVGEWVKEVGLGKVPGIAPFKSITHALLSRTNLGAPPCGSGWGSLSINPDGGVMACPIAFDAPWARLGSIFSSSWKDLLSIVGIGEPCTRCSYYGVCGGRCLYAHNERLWGMKGFQLLCGTTKRLIDLLRGHEPAIRDFVSSGALRVDQLTYPPYLNSIEIIP